MSEYRHLERLPDHVTINHKSTMSNHAITLTNAQLSADKAHVELFFKSPFGDLQCEVTVAQWQSFVPAQPGAQQSPPPDAPPPTNT